MGKRSRKQRSAGPVETTTAAPTAAPRRPVQSTNRRAAGQSRVDRFIERADERPKPPWHPVPLVELSVLAGLVLLVVGVINHDSSHGRIMMVFGLALASLAGLDTALREHFNGFRSHSSLLAGVPAVVAVTALGLCGVHGALLIAAAAVVFGAGFMLLRRAFRARAGVAFRV
jgi:Flp pilus assembly protein TadB